MITDTISSLKTKWKEVFDQEKEESKATEVVADDFAILDEMKEEHLEFRTHDHDLTLLHLCFYEEEKSQAWKILSYLETLAVESEQVVVDFLTHKTRNSINILDLCCWYGCTSILQFLLTFEVFEPYMLSLQRGENFSPLSLAIISSETETVQMLITHGVDIDFEVGESQSNIFNLLPYLMENLSYYWGEHPPQFLVHLFLRIRKWFKKQNRGKFIDWINQVNKDGEHLVHSLIAYNSKILFTHLKDAKLLEEFQFSAAENPMFYCFNSGIEDLDWSSQTTFLSALVHLQTIDFSEIQDGYTTLGKIINSINGYEYDSLRPIFKVLLGEQGLPWKRYLSGEMRSNALYAILRCETVDLLKIFDEELRKYDPNWLNTVSFGYLPLGLACFDFLQENDSQTGPVTEEQIKEAFESRSFKNIQYFVQRGARIIFNADSILGHRGALSLFNYEEHNGSVPLKLLEYLLKVLKGFGNITTYQCPGRLPLLYAAIESKKPEFLNLLIDGSNGPLRPSSIRLLPCASKVPHRLCFIENMEEFFSIKKETILNVTFTGNDYSDFTYTCQLCNRGVDVMEGGLCCVNVNCDTFYCMKCIYAIPDIDATNKRRIHLQSYAEQMNGGNRIKKLNSINFFSSPAGEEVLASKWGCLSKPEVADMFEAAGLRDIRSSDIPMSFLLSILRN
eukprot:snap_masked-scaffold_18-processed-gene-4.18-mRNA-1 protein AED:1.00 eAED:1.00 QI:0/-1/0/0/-1/1/1/0/676